jgi:beta-mannanase
MEPLLEFELQAERPVDLIMWYQDWVHTGELDVGLIQRVADHGAVPLLTWDPWDYTQGPSQPSFALSRVLEGAFDSYISAWARELAGYDGPLLLRFAHEMNGHWYPWGTRARSGPPGATAAEYVQTWRHVWRLFQAAGAHQVQWVWAPNILEGAGAFEVCYPGSEYVDWLALDGYNWGGWRRWRSFRQLFAASYRRLTALGPQPVMIAETACAEAGGDKARWITEGLTQVIPDQMPRVRAVVWFNQAKERDWRIESSDASRLAFAEAVKDPPFQVAS